MSVITIDGLDEEIFRRNIEGMLRVGEVDRAAAKLRALIAPFCGEGKILPARFAEVTSADIQLNGWDKLAVSLARNDRPRHPISALTIAVSNAEVLGFDSDDVGPVIATSHYTDEAYPFSASGIGDLLDGYSFYGCEWHGSSAHVDTALSLGGIEDLYRAIAKIEEELFTSARPDPDKIRAGSIGSCYLAVLVHQAVRDAVRNIGVPRPICVMAGNEGIYPYFDAPVIGTVECVEQGLVAGAGVAAAETTVLDGAGAAAQVTLAEADGEEIEATEGAAIAVGTYGSLSGLVSRKAEKKPVLQLAEADAQSSAEMFEQAGEDWMRGGSGILPPLAEPTEPSVAEWADKQVADGDIFADPASFREFELAEPTVEIETWEADAALYAAPVDPIVEHAADTPPAEPVLEDVVWPISAPQPLDRFEEPEDLRVEPAVPQLERVRRASHSIRSQIAMPQPEEEPEKPGLWSRLLKWFGLRR